MDNFDIFRARMQKHFEDEMKDCKQLYIVNVDKDEMWNLYLDSFGPGTNILFRKRREYDCSCCRHFVKSIGAAVTIKDGTIHTIWGFDAGSEEFQKVCDALDSFVKGNAISDIFVSKFKRVGTDNDFEEINGRSHKWTHMVLDLPDSWVNRSCKTNESIQGEYRDTKNVFKRSLDEISMEAVDTVLELINSNTLYKGEEWKAQLIEFKKYKRIYEKLSNSQKDLFAWEKSAEAGPVIGRIRNHSIGTLLVNISEGMDLDQAVRKYEVIVAPANYKRVKAIFTKKMLEDAKKTIAELGYMDALQRRFANLDDITVNNILFSNKDAAKRIVGADDIFGQMEKEVVVNPKKFSKVEEISAQDFIDKVLPTARELEVFVENKHASNFVSLIAPVNKDAKPMFKWNNPLSWAYSGNITDSDIRRNVKDAGGKVDGVLRFSIQWNDNQDDNSDLDAHCIEPNSNTIYFADKIGRTGGRLDVDITEPMSQRPGVPSVENIVWSSYNRMIPGTYKFYVNQYAARGSKGFSAEIAFGEETYSFNYPHPVVGRVGVAEVTMNKYNEFTIKPILPTTSETISKEIWGVSTNQFVPVSVISYSPNYFDDQNGIGHRHLFFFLKGCKNTEEPNGYYNEFLKHELEPHKRVFEALGAKCHVENADDQLSGIGFSMTKRAELVVKVKGATERIMKIKF